MVRFGCDESVVYFSWMSIWVDEWKFDQWGVVKDDMVRNVEIKIDVVEMMQQGVVKDIGLLDVLVVVGVVRDDVWVVGGEEFGGIVVSLYVVFLVVMKVVVGLDGILVFCEICVVECDKMYFFWDNGF